ncbi:hypothetical protein K501DRAFT_337064 [Backusella circina FSU 941]|nr:hypothetical protein K501DRAFT_337064 [Backusella circina FSU 941]
MKEWGRAAVDLEHRKHTRKIRDDLADTVLLTRFKLLMQSRRDQKTGELIIKSPSISAFTGLEKPINNESNISTSSSSRPLMNNSNISSVTSAQESPINCVPIIADYLREINGYIRQEMKKHFPMMSDPSKFRYIMTVPAKWGEYEKRDMRKAAVDAGIIHAEDHENRLSIITESHAATLYCEWELKDKFEFKKGQKYLVCDAGGGTVDLEIQEVLGEEEARSHNTQEGGMLTRCKLATKGNERSGSTFLDQRMEDFIRNQFDGPISDSEMYQLINDFINRVKPLFGEKDEEDDIYFNLPPGVPPLYSGADATIHEGRLIINYDVFKTNIFDPVVNKILNLLKQQINKVYASIDATFLIGGFGKSPYLQRAIKEKLGSRVGKLFVPADGDLAAMKGAILYGVNMPRMLNKPVIRLDSFYDKPSFKPFEVLICIDLGLETASCSFTFLHEFNGMGHTIDVTEWPNREKGVRDIATKISYSLKNRDVLNWGDKAEEDEAFGDITCPIYSTHHESAFHDYLRCIHEYVCKKVSKHSFISSNYSDRARYRYCISYVDDGHYKKTAYQMRNYAILAGLVDRSDSQTRLRLIPRSNAYTMYCDKMTVKIEHHFLQCDVSNAKCTLDIYGSVKSSTSRKTTVNHIWSNQRKLLPIRDYMRRYLLTQPYFRRQNLYELDSFGNNEVESVLKKFDEIIIPIFSDNSDLYPNSEKRQQKYRFELPKQNSLSRLFRNSDNRTIIMTGEEIIMNVYKPAFKDLLNEIEAICIQETASICKLDAIFIQGDFTGCYPYLNQGEIFEKFSRNNSAGPLRILTKEKMKHTFVRGALSYGSNHMIWTHRIASYTYDIRFRTFPEPEPDHDFSRLLNEGQYNEQDTVSSIYSDNEYSGLSLSVHSEFGERRPLFLGVFRPDSSNSRQENELLEKDNFILLREGDPITISRGDLPFIEKKFHLKGYGNSIAEIHRYKKGSSEEVTKVHQFNIICKRREDFVVSIAITPTSIQIGCRSTSETGFKEPNYISDEPILLQEQHN